MKQITVAEAIQRDRLQPPQELPVGLADLTLRQRISSPLNKKRYSRPGSRPRPEPPSQRKAPMKPAVCCCAGFGGSQFTTGQLRGFGCVDSLSAPIVDATADVVRGVDLLGRHRCASCPAARGRASLS